MTINIPDEYAPKVNELMSQLPNNPYVIDVVGKAVDIAYKHPGFTEKLDIAIEAAKFATATSNPMYYSTYLVQAPLVSCLDATEYTVIDNASGTLRDTAEVLTQFLTTNSFKERWRIMYNAGKNNPSLLALILMHVNQDLEQLLAKPSENRPVGELLLLTGIGYLECSLRMSDVNILNTVYPYKNKLTALILNSAEF